MNVQYEDMTSGVKAEVTDDFEITDENYLKAWKISEERKPVDLSVDKISSSPKVNTRGNNDPLYSAKRYNSNGSNGSKNKNTENLKSIDDDDV